MRTIEQMISSEVLCCMSSLVSTLARGAFDCSTFNETAKELDAMCEQAFDLAAPTDDWEEAAREAGWSLGGYAAGGEDGTESWEGWYRIDETADDGMARYDTAQEACDRDGVDPYQREVFEHWAVTDWFADKLEAAGEKVDKDFAGLCIWARTTTGQAIYADGVIERIYAETHRA